MSSTNDAMEDRRKREMPSIKRTWISWSWTRRPASLPRPRLADRLRGPSVRAGPDSDAEAVVAFDIHDRKDDAKRGRRCAQGQTGCLRAFAGMTPVAMATATACVKLMQLNLWRAVSRYVLTLANDRFRIPAMSW